MLSFIEIDSISSIRTVQFQGLNKTSCGGTHVENSNEVGEVTIRSFKNEKGDLKIGYDVK